MNQKSLFVFLRSSILSWTWVFAFITGCEVHYLNMPTKEKTIQAVTATEERVIVSTAPSTSVPIYFEYKRNCLPVSSRLEIDDISSGLILHEVSPTDSKGNVDILNLSNLTLTQFFSKDEKVNGIRISPNKSWVAYSSIRNDNQVTSVNLIVRNFATNEIIELPWEKEWRISGIKNWVSNQVLLIDKINNGYPTSIVAMNPFTNEKLTIPLVFPNQEIKSADGYFPLPQYNSTLDYVIYPASNNGEIGYLLKKVSSIETVSFIQTQTLTTFSAPVWSNNGTGYILSIKPFDDHSFTFDLIYGNTSGKTTLVINLGKDIESYYIDNIVWSPDDQYVAFIVNDVTDINNQVDRLMILDMTNRKVLDYCVNVNYENWRGEFADINFPIWSPNSRELIVENQFEQGKNDVILINLSKTTASIIEKNKRILGWVSLKR